MVRRLYKWNYRSFGNASRITEPDAKVRGHWPGRNHLDHSRSSNAEHLFIRVHRHPFLGDLDMLQLRDIEVISSVVRYYTLTRAQINRLHFPTDSDGRITRKRLRVLHEEGLINRTNMQVVNPAMGAPAYVYFPSSKGCAFLAQELKDDRFLSACTRTPNWTHLYHWVEVAQTHILLDQAIVKFPGVSKIEWISEWTLLNADEKEPEKRFKLYTRLGPKLVCAPDAAFLLQRLVEEDEFRKVFYLEQDRDTTENANRVAAQKCHGFASLYERRMHVARHFPIANVDKFTVLFVAPSPNRRDALCKAFADKPAAKLYRFVSQTDLTADTFLVAPIWYSCAGEPTSLLKNGGAT